MKRSLESRTGLTISGIRIVEIVNPGFQEIEHSFLRLNAITT